MNRRKFLGLGLAAATLVPAALNATDFRTEKPDMWKAEKMEDAIKAIYGDAKIPEEGVSIKAPKLAENGGAIPVFVKSDIEGAKSVALFQDANPRSAVAVWTVPENGIIDYGLKIKMRKTGKLTAIVEDKDGKLFSKVLSVEVSIGGCGG